jgi:hypothetical protein
MQTKFSRKKYGKGYQKWQDTETKKMAIDGKMEGDGQKCLGK